MQTGLISNFNIGFIGGGNMARAIIAGLIESGHTPEKILVSNPGAEKRQQLAQSFGVQTFADNQNVAESSDVLILAVKPQMMKAALSQIKPGSVNQKTVISVAAGFPLSQLRALLGENNQYVRAMPNTPALIGEGASGLYAEENTHEPARAIATAIFACVGKSLWVSSEQQIDLVTAIAGSSPAYFFLMAEAMSASAEKLGMAAADAQMLILQAMKGAALLAQKELARENGDSLTELRRRVTSPGGTTQAAIECLQSHKFEALVGNAVKAAFARGQQLAQS